MMFIHLYNYLSRIYALLLNEFKRMFRFGLVGLTGFFVNLATIYLSRSILMNYLMKEIATAISSYIGFEVSLTWNFILHEKWTFRDLDLSRSVRSRILRWLKFHIGSLGSMATQVSVVTIMSGFMDYPIYLSLFIGVSLGMLLNYSFSRLYAWRK